MSVPPYSLVASAAYIVRALAAVDDPTVADRDFAPAAQCGLCRASDPAYVHVLDDPARHAQMAREWAGGA